MPVSISGREVDDGDDDKDEDDTLRRDCGVETYRKHETAAEEVVAMEADDTEKLEEQDAVGSMFVDGRLLQNEMTSDIPTIKGGSPPLSTSNGGVITEMDVDGNISNTESYLIGNEGEEVPFESTIMHEGKCADVKSEVGGIVSDSLRRQEEVDSIRVTEVDNESETLICDAEDGNIESVKMEKNSSLNKT
jgi:hypothetical protein